MAVLDFRWSCEIVGISLIFFVPASYFFSSFIRRSRFSFGVLLYVPSPPLWQWYRSTAEAGFGPTVEEGEKEDIKPQGFNSQSSGFQELFSPFVQMSFSWAFSWLHLLCNFPLCLPLGQSQKIKQEGGIQKEIYCWCIGLFSDWFPFPTCLLLTFQSPQELSLCIISGDFSCNQLEREAAVGLSISSGIKGT